MKEMEELLCKLLWGQLRLLGLFSKEGILEAEFEAKAGIKPKYDRWLHETLMVLTQHHYLSYNGTSFFVTHSEEVDLDALWSEWNLQKRVWIKDRSMKSRIVFVEATLRVLPDILTGKVPATDVIFPNSSMKLVEGIYKENPLADYYNEVLANTAVAYMQEILAHDSKARFRLLEIGAGTGGTSAMVFQKLKPYHEHLDEYCYTDVSKAFLQHAEQEYGPHNPYLTYQIYDVEKPADRQSIQIGEYNLVIATNVLHATSNIRQTLRNAKVLLKKNGLLLINEISCKSVFAHLTFGLLEGWWLYEDPSLRIPGCPGLVPTSWKRALEQEGFHSVFFPAEKAHHLGQQVVVAQSDGVARLNHLSKNNPAPKQSASQKKKTTLQPTSAQRVDDVTDQMIRDFVRDALIEKLSDSLKMDAQLIDADESFSDYGLDSITGVQFVTVLNETLQTELLTTSLFDYSSVHKLTDYIVSEYKKEISDRLGVSAQPVSVNMRVLEKQQEPVSEHSEHNRFLSKDAPLDLQTADSLECQRESFSKDPIAIIGMSGKFAKADTLEELWDHLANGDDLIEEVTRWDLSKYFGKTKYCNHGGFIKDIDQFDPFFFSISGTEAAYMDPQQRLFLEEAWKALEDAGYAGTGMDGRACGIYVGFNMDYYSELIGEEAPAQAMWGNAGSVIPARLAYYLNLQGPAVTVDTACSSSLVSIHLACQSLWSRETEMALAGGVFLQPTPGFYISANRAGMLSPKGRCYTFDERADGFVPGEGVGVVVLKRLQDAIADGDHIYGVIRGSGVNQDGTTNGITAPSANSQERLIRHVYDSFCIDPQNIQWIEAHGTGTKLGDPIEYQALTRAFQGYTDKTKYCAIGSIKTNIGHTTAAAGVAGVIKILLALKHKQIPPSINFQTGNSNIQFADSPFYVNTSRKAWDVQTGLKRCAAISAFGFSGTNAHMVIEEAPQIMHRHADLPGIILALSARTSDELREQVSQLIKYCERDRDVNYHNMSYTLLVGRKHFPYRVSCVARNGDELVSTLKEWLMKGTAASVYQTEPNKNDQREKATLRRYGNECIEKCLQIGHEDEYLEQLSTVAELYAQGYTLEYKRLFAGKTFFKIPLPKYPFAKERYWVPDTKNLPKKHEESTKRKAELLHPLLHHNTSTLSGQRFCSIFTGEEFFTSDHVVKGQRVFPGVAYLEMARAAVEASVGDHKEKLSGIKLTNVIWLRPIVISEAPVEVQIKLSSTNEAIAYEICSEPISSNTEPILHSQGKAIVSSFAKIPTLPIPEIQKQCNGIEITSEECYAMFRKIGLDYGECHQGIEYLYAGSGQVLAKLTLPKKIYETKDSFLLHPSLLDSALQAVSGLTSVTIHSDKTASFHQVKPALPFALDEVEIFGGCVPSMWAYIRSSGDSLTDARTQKVDIDLCDEQGTVCARIKGLMFREIGTEAEEGIITTALEKEDTTTLLLQPEWIEKPVTAHDSSESDLFRQVVILCELDEAIRDDLIRTVYKDGIDYLVLDSSGTNSMAERFQLYAWQLLEKIQGLQKGKIKGKILIQIVTSSTPEMPVFLGLSGLLLTARIENPQIVGQMIEAEAGATAEALFHKLEENSRSPHDFSIRYEAGKRLVATWTEVKELFEQTSLPWKNSGTYLITGGAGGLGFIFASEIAHQVTSPKLILIGRSAITEDGLAKLKELERAGAYAEYMQVDIAHEHQVQEMIRHIQEKFGSIQGIIHSAGVVQDRLMLNKTQDELNNVMAPKVAGLIHLAEASRNSNLDWFIVCSAAAAVLGNAGQADYAAANAFTDAYAAYYNKKLGQNQGRMISINWPLWKDGGMKVNQSTEKMLKESLGMVAMPSQNGIRALYRGMATCQNQIVVLEGNEHQLKQAVGILPRKQELKIYNVENALSQEMLEENTISFVKQVLAEAINLSVDRIQLGTTFEKYGLDSIMQIELIKTLEKVTGELSKTLLFEYNTTQELVEYLVVNHRDRLNEWFLSHKEEASGQAPAVAIDWSTTTDFSNESKQAPNSQTTQLPEHSVASNIQDNDDIAIIGISGRYPLSKNVEELWEHLVRGDNCITKASIMSRSSSFVGSLSENLSEENTPQYYGGFLDDRNRFDHYLFEMETSEALELPPEVRLFLETAWETFEDAGYSKDALRAFQRKNATGIGVFVGAMYNQYPWTMPSMEQAVLHSNRTDWQIANRASHFFDLKGPSIAINTACSSSLTAIHLACESLKQNSCSMAIAGGVNLTLDPSKYVSLDQINFLGSGNQSKSFGTGDGYIPGEGVGAVLLKPLSLAMEDRDKIYGIIKGSYMNHSGGRQKYSVPDPKQQTELIEEAIKRSGIDPETITYVESAANGSELGDPIEVVALRNAFAAYTSKKQFCALGSIKSNVGHLEAASGISQLSKVLLQLKHKTLVPTINASVRNPNIKLEHTAFYLQEKTENWDQLQDFETGRTIPRRSMINSFGAGGSYANLIIEEYLGDTPSKAKDTDSEEVLLIFSAKTKWSLMEYSKRLLVLLKKNDSVSLSDLANSLYRINQNLTYRIGLLASSLEDVKAKLESLLQHEPAEDSVFISLDVPFQDYTPPSTTSSQDEGLKGLRELAEDWIAGASIDFWKQCGNMDSPLIDLPKYAFDHHVEFDFHLDHSTVIDENAEFNEEFYREILEKVSKGEISKNKALQLFNKLEV
ncbi:SDR family NAD(P)-dependent oxidoreductase [Brevibacillus sp. 7WMA2]|uniref:SDR family NAD(P)-dependent oxidoreductase n=1 Tax=Brevibacillus sp. 7WMA2 TaxID=2683193 RepID=UPI0013A72A82|nr:SDR family NAD(P)-dependent oxidoreductase [Brevibacillus sp. 7WMA2]QIC04831.1 SDR family NAD(P)-dependent oxidoreductase [Brevibacillus sp. 7WMA2]